MQLIIKKIIRRFKYIKNIILSKILYPIYKQNYKYDIIDDIEAVDEIISKNKSVARFGDGEFKWLLNIEQNSFQKADENLTKKLMETIQCKNEKLLIGIPRAFISLENYNKFAKKEWKYFIYSYGKRCKEIIPKSQRFIDTNITRCYMDYEDKSNSMQRFNNLKRIWDEREIVIVEGNKTKLGVGNDLFNNTRSIQRILAPSVNAFEKINELIEVVKKVSTDKLILISLGPTATVLAYELTKIGYQAIDIGHIDIEYEWCKMNANSKIPIKGKFVNEAISVGDLSDENIPDGKYNESIIFDLSN